MATDLSKLTFDSRQNYMKRDVSTGSATLTLGGYGTTVTQTVNHNLGYIPIIHVSYEPTGDGTIFSSEKIHTYTESSLGGVDPAHPKLTYWTTTAVLTINLINNTSPTATGTRNIYWCIYLDYGNV